MIESIPNFISSTHAVAQRRLRASPLAASLRRGRRALLAGSRVAVSSSLMRPCVAAAAAARCGPASPPPCAVGAARRDQSRRRCPHA